MKRKLRSLHRRNFRLLACFILPGILFSVPIQGVHAAEDSGDEKEKTSRVSDDAVPLIEPAAFPKRPRPWLEWGNPFLGTGDIRSGVELPGGAVVQPSFMIFGTYRSAFQLFHDGDTTSTEWANRLDLFGNLQLSGTERILIGFRPLDEDGQFSGYQFQPQSEWEEQFNGEVNTLFFEGEFGEIFPDLDPDDSRGLDWGFSVGRQPINLQDGMLINDTIDAIGITRNTLLPSGGSNLQFTALYGWNQIHRDDNREYDDQHLVAFSAIADYPKSTLSIDAVLVEDESSRDADGAFWGVGAVQRIGHYNTTFRVLGSHALEEESALVSDGLLLFSEISWTPPWTEDIVYVNGFVGIDEFSSAARGPSMGGPLGRTGITFAAVELGRYGAPLGNVADESYGAAVGYQMFLDHTRKQIIFEVGARRGMEDDAMNAWAAAIRYQQALGQQWVLQADVFATLREAGDEALGIRLELRYEF